MIFTGDIPQPLLLAALRHRYPDLEITEAVINDFPDIELPNGGPSQRVEFRGPLARLMEQGLVTEAMIDNANDRRRGTRTTPIGDGFTLFWEDVAGYPARLTIFTRCVPRERPRMAVQDALRVLRRFTTAKA